jgi:hypothetical protein
MTRHLDGPTVERGSPPLRVQARHGVAGHHIQTSSEGQVVAESESRAGAGKSERQLAADGHPPGAGARHLP